MTEDFIAWHLTSTYRFSVKSAYYAQWQHSFGQNVNRADGQSSSECNPVWEILWNLSVPAKVNFFSWKALHGTIPGLAVLVERHIKTPVQCPICIQGPEDMKHLLFSCPRARQIWKSLGLMEAINSVLPSE